MNQNSKQDSIQDSKQDSKQDSIQDIKPDSKQDSKQDSKPDSKGGSTEVREGDWTCSDTSCQVISVVVDIIIYEWGYYILQQLVSD